MTAAGRMWRCAKRAATRRISCTDQRISGGSWDHRQAAFWGCGGVGLEADGGEHGKGQHDERDVPVPAVAGACLDGIETNFVFTRHETVLDGPARSFDTPLRLDRRAGGAPVREKGQGA